MNEVILFILVVGIGSCVLFDIWTTVIAKCTGKSIENWGLPGRWVIGVTKGQWKLADSTTKPTITEKSVGWVFHYVASLVYAILLVAIWGTEYIQFPTFAPAYLIGGVLTTLAGSFIMMPGMGLGILCSRIKGREPILNKMVVNHTFYAISLYVLALIVAGYY